MNSIFDLYIFRHGETDWNAQKRFQGHTDVPLNDKGREQAKELTKKLSYLDPEVCLSSDLSRAVETGKIGLSEKKVSYVYTEALRETFLGDVEGWTLIKIIEHFGEETMKLWRSVHQDHLHMSFPGGESKSQHLDRVKNFIDNFVSNNRHYSRIAISTHGGSVVRLAHHCINSPKETVAIPNCCLYHIKYNFSSKEFTFCGEIGKSE